MNDMKHFSRRDAHNLACELAYHPLFEVTRVERCKTFAGGPWSIRIRQRRPPYNETFITCLGLLRAVTAAWSLNH